jgi:hypothetical protein
MPERLPSIEATSCKKSACLDKNNILPLRTADNPAEVCLSYYKEQTPLPPLPHQ